MKPEDKIRISADVPPGVHVKALELCAMLGEGGGVSLREAIVRSMLFTRQVLSHVQAGGTFILRKADGTEREVMLL